MIANRRTRFPASGACAALLLLLCSCVGPAPVNIPVSTAPQTIVLPVPLPTSTDWHDMPATAGAWQWRREGGKSLARFRDLQDEALLSLSCVRAESDGPGLVSLSRAGQMGASITMLIKTTSQSRMLTMGPGTTNAILLSRDPLLDAMAFSRGRFAVEVTGMATLYLPSWPEVARVIEDCRE